MDGIGKPSRQGKEVCLFIAICCRGFNWLRCSSPTDLGVRKIPICSVNDWLNDAESFSMIVEVKFY